MWSSFSRSSRELDLVLRDGEVAASSQAVKWRRLGVALFSLPAWIAYGAIVVAAMVAMVRNHNLVPRYQHLFFTQAR